MSQPVNEPPRPQPQWADAAGPEGEPPRYAFHRLMRRAPEYAWWRPLAVGSTAVGFYIVLTVVLVVGGMLVMLASPAAWMDTAFVDSMESETELLLDMADPATFILTMLSLIVLLPACYFAYLLLGPKPSGLLWSVAGKLRLKWLGVATLAALVVYVLYFGATLALQAAGVISSEPVPPESVPDSPLLLAILVIALVPFQAAAEEYLFRGMLMQIIGSWLRHPLFAILLPVPLFVLGHLYDLYGQIDIAVFALAAGYLTWRTGGLEAAIGMHVVNNVVLFLLGSAGLADMNADSTSLGSLIASAGLTVALTFIMVRLADRFRIERTAGPAPLPPQPQYLVPWSAPQNPYGYTAPGLYPPAAPGAPQPHPTGAYWAPVGDPVASPPPPPQPAPEPGQQPAGDRNEQPPS